MAFEVSILIRLPFDAPVDETNIIDAIRELIQEFVSDEYQLDSCSIENAN